MRSGISKQKQIRLFVLLALVMAACFVSMTVLHSFVGPSVLYFICLFGIAALVYFVAVFRLADNQLPASLIWGFAIVFRLILLSTSPSLSTDIYRYAWDGHLLKSGINPYAFPVNDPRLDPYTTPLRSYVQHEWMASPYLPASQMLFYLIELSAPQNIRAYQAGMLVLDLCVGCLIFDLLKRLRLPQQYVLLYLWHPLVVIEFSQAAHQDILMIFFTLLSFWMLSRMDQKGVRSPKWLAGSALGMTAATLTKGLPFSLVPVFLPYWKWKYTALYLFSMAVVLSGFAFNAGWGLVGELDGTGIFGALRIYLHQWNYNSSIYHWLETGLTGVVTSGAVPVNAATEIPIFIAKAITTVLFGASILITAFQAWRISLLSDAHSQTNTLNMLQLTTLSIGAYLLLAATLHPWYVTFIVPFLVFLLPCHEGGRFPTNRFVWPWLYLSCAVVISYLTYIDLSDLHEYPIMRSFEYYPFFILLVWASWPFIKDFAHSIIKKIVPQDQHSAIPRHDPTA